MTTSLYVRLPHRPIQSPERWSQGALASVPFVQALVRDFAATVVPGSIQPHAH
ncbi:hypothetical protein [Ralstonia pseudosolanacearum]|uniref:hypothetical protein n=1 Tax=Ralstonia pseudosolanacearum TaxID=1310165 RepID=UPI003CE6E71D